MGGVPYAGRLSKQLVWKYSCVTLFLFVLTVTLTFYSEPPKIEHVNKNKINWHCFGVTV